MNNDITKMQYKALREKVQEHEDALAKLKRYLEDALSNISSDNFSKEFRMEQDNFKAEIRFAADELSSVYKNSDELSQMQSEIRQNAERILLCASKEYVDGKISTAQINVSAEAIQARVSSEVTNQMSGITLSSDKIIMTTGSTLSEYGKSVSRKFISVENSAINSAKDNSVKNDCLSSMGYFKPGKDQVTKLEDDGEYIALVTSFEQKKMLCLYNDSYYYYTNSNKYLGYDRGMSVWVKCDETAGETVNKTMFTMDKDGFWFTNNVNIDGDLVTEGKIKSQYIQTSTLACSKIYDASFSVIQHSPYISVVGVGDDKTSMLAGFGLLDANLDTVSFSDIQGTGCVFGVSQPTAVTSAESGGVNIYMRGQAILGYNPISGKVFPKGKWDFSSCTVTGM